MEEKKEKMEEKMRRLLGEIRKLNAYEFGNHEFDTELEAYKFYAELAYGLERLSEIFFGRALASGRSELFRGCSKKDLEFSVYLDGTHGALGRGDKTVDINKVREGYAIHSEDGINGVGLKNEVLKFVRNILKEIDRPDKAERKTDLGLER